MSQDGWRRCNKCQGLFYSDNPKRGICPAEGKEHSHDGSNNYALQTIR